MAAVDHERVLVKLKAHIASKASHGRTELLRKLTEFEVSCELPEGQEGFDGMPLRRVAPVEQHDEYDHGASPSSNETPTEALA